MCIKRDSWHAVNETVARLLMTISHDCTIMEGNMSLEVEEAIFHRPIKVIDFLLHLFHERFHDMIRGMLPVATKAGFETLLLLLRGMAFQCCHTQRSIDLI